MSVKVMSWVWDHSQSKGTDRLVLLAIADSADDDGDNAWPSIATLTRKAGVDARTVQRSIRRLQELGEVSVEPNAGRKGVNVYRVHATPRQTVTPGATPPRQRATPAPCHPTPGTLPPHPRQSATPTPGTTPPEPSITHPEPSLTHPDTPAPEPDTDDGFDDFWAAYPRHAAKPKARAAYRSALRRTDPATILAAAARYRADPNRLDEFTKHPTTWLNGDCWNDPPLPQRGTAPGKRSTDDIVHAHLDLAQRLAAQEAAQRHDRQEITR